MANVRPVAANPQARILALAEELERLDAEMTPKPWDPFFQDVVDEHGEDRERWVEMGPTDPQTTRRADSTLLERDADVIGIARLRNLAGPMAKGLRNLLEHAENYRDGDWLEGAVQACLNAIAAPLEDEP